MEYNFSSKYDSVTQARDFLEGEIQELKINLERSEEELGEYSSEHGILNMAAGENLVVQKLVELNRQLTQLEGQLLANRYENIRDMTVENLPAGMKTKKMEDLERKISDLDLQLASLTSQFGPKWPAVKKLEDELSAAREQLVQAARQAIEQEGIQYELFNEHSNRLTRAVGRQEELVSKLRESLIQYNILLREVDSDKELYDGLLQRIKEAGISAGLRSSNVRVIEPGTVPLNPYVPDTPLYLALGLALGLMLGCPLALLLELLDKSLRTSEDIEQQLGIPCLSVIPVLDSSIVERGRELLGEHNGGAKATQIVPYLRNMPPVCWESYRSLRTSLLLSSAGKPPQTILVSSALPSEGKSTTTVNLGISYAQTGARVLIMELDLRRPRLAERLSVRAGLGMSTYLSGNSELASEIRPTNIPNLFLIPGGPIPPNPPELIGSERMRSAFRLLSQHFDILLVDGPPILSVTDSLVVSSSVDGVVLVVEAGKTPKDAALRAQNRLASVGATILGAIINKVEMNSAGYEYDIRYDYGDSYSSADDA
jgi:capsular exopolysaccharide synthesis family protein